MAALADCFQLLATSLAAPAFFSVSGGLCSKSVELLAVSGGLFGGFAGLSGVPGGFFGASCGLFGVPGELLGGLL